MPSAIRAFTLLSFATLACNAGPAAITAPKVVITPQGLEQTVRLSPEAPAPGETVDITSLVVNQTTSTIDVTSRICGLDIESSLGLVNSSIHCAGYSMQGALAVGDTIQGFDRRVVSGMPGTYMVRVRHLLNPDVWVEVPVTVVGLP